MTGWLVRVAVAGMLLLTACSDGPTAISRVDHVEVDAEEQSLVVGDSTMITALPLTAAGDVVVGVVLWRSLNPDVATVRVNSNTAVLAAKAPGTVRIEAESGGKVGYVDVTIAAAPQVATVTILPQTLVLRQGDEATIRAEAQSADGAVITGRAVTWTVVGAGVTVTPEATPGWATIEAQLYGEVTVRATIDGVVGEAAVQVVTTTPPPAQVATVEITPGNFSLPVNHETSLQAIAKDAQGAILSGRQVTWTSTAPTVAAVTAIGVSPFASLLARAAGTTTIRATIDGVSGEMTVQVTAAPPPANQVLYFLFSPNHRGIWANQLLDMSQHLRAIGVGGVALDPEVTWAVEDSSIATVDDSGNVRGLTAGTTRVYAYTGDHEAIALVTVFQPTPGPVVYDLTYDWWDVEWHMPPQVGTETWTDDAGVDHDVVLWPTTGSMTMTAGGSYERVIRIQGWATVDGAARLVIDRDVIDAGTYTIMVGGETGYRMFSQTTAGYEFDVVGAYNAGHLLMRAAIGTAPSQTYMLRMRQ